MNTNLDKLIIIGDTAKENILADKVSGYKAAEQLIDLYFDNLSKTK